MTTPKPVPVPAAPRAGLIASWVSFWFSPNDPVGLHALRVLGGLLFLFWLLPFAGNVEALFGLGGWFDAQAYKEASRLPELPPHLFGWSLAYLCGTNATLLVVVYWLFVVAILLFTAGVATRLTGVLTWVAVVSFTANPAIAYDADPLLLMLAFYLMVGYLLLGQRRPGQSLVSRLLGSKETWVFGRAAGPANESVGANLAVRLFQVHFAIAMVASGLHKLQIREWWNGLAPWFYVNPPFATTAQQVKSYASGAATFLTIFSLCAYVVLAWQLGFPAFAWRRGWAARTVLLGGAALAWVATTLFVSLPLFGPIMVVACLGYLTPGEWHRLLDLLARLPGVRVLFSRGARAPVGGAVAGPKGGTGIKAVVSVGSR